MAAPKKATAGSQQAAKPQKLLKSGVTPDVGKATQFKPGQSGNPAGRKQGSKNLSTRIQELLNDEKFETWLYDPHQGFIEYKGAPLDVVIGVLIRKALAGGQDALKAFELLAKYGFGAKVELAGTIGIQPVEPKVISKIAERVTDAGTEVEAEASN